MMSGVTPKAWAANGLPSAAEAGDDFIEDQQDAVLVADFAQALQVADRWDQAAGGAGDRLDKASGDRVGAVSVDEALKVIGEVDAAMCRAALLETVFLKPGVPQGDDVGHRQGENVAVLDHARQRDAANVDAVVGPLARDHADAAGFAAGIVVGHCDLQRGIDRLGAGVGEEDVVHFFWEKAGDHAGQFK